MAPFHRPMGELKKEPRGEKIHVGAEVLSRKSAKGSVGRRSEVQIGETMPPAFPITQSPSPSSRRTRTPESAEKLDCQLREEGQ
jgi:hypothetical protein